jgi:predicted nucleic acid-binding protein
MIVLDASVALEVVLCTGVGHRLFLRLFERQDALQCPYLLDLEVLQVLRRKLLAGSLPLNDCERAVGNLAILPVTRHPHSDLLSRIWALRNNLTAYDAVYVALAEELGATLLTRDAKLASSSGHRARIELI